jgi:5-methyltetrahydrofolate--homocysteine methyltransferase
MATVKGDVHDIGKNIVGVVLGCNNYEVIDMGVMVPANKILEAAIEHNVDVIGLSGLITPSLDEMVHVAKELERAKLDIPLLIGGATTSKAHTAVKIDRHYSAPSIHVLDASRSVTIVEKLLGDRKDALMSDINIEYDRVREQFLERQAAKKYLRIEDARVNLLKVKFSNAEISKPNFLGNKTFENVSLKEIATYIDWTPFFQTWELAGKYPEILTDEVVGEQATELFADAKKMLSAIIEEKWLTANGVIGIWEAEKSGDDIKVQYQNGTEEFHFLRQQNEFTKGKSNKSLSDFVASKEESDQDYLGGFAVTSGIGIEKHIERFEKDHDDYSSIMLKALADRLAEGFAEFMHQKVRTEIWGYQTAEDLSNEELIKEKYQGIRPAPGYPACPEHTEKETLFKLLDANKMGIVLTESMAMQPGAAVSGFYFAHTDAAYFNVGKIGKDQVADYARRKNWSTEIAEKWLSPILNY